jgi:N6-L-threonylcarbamoyladenine synthase
MKDHGKYKIIGETRDDAVGEAFDKVAKILGLGYPGGPAIAALAEKPEAQGRKLEAGLPRPMLDSPDFDFSFAGLKTAVLYLVRDLTKKYSLDEIKAEVAYEFQNAAVEVLVAKTIRAAKEFKIKTVLLAGGVAANKKLRADLRQAVGDAGVSYVQPNLEYTTDNAAMIATAGYFNYVRNPKQYKNAWKKIKIDPNLKL